MTVKEVRQTAQRWADNNRKLMDQSRGTQKEQYRGFMMGCYAICDLIDGKTILAKALAHDPQTVVISLPLNGTVCHKQ